MKTNLQFFLNTYSDLLSTTTPSRNNFKWLREINGIPFTVENDQQIQVLPSVTTPNIIPYPFSTPTNSGSDTTNSTTTLTIDGPTAGIAAGNLIVGSGIPIGTTVVSVQPLTTFTVTSANASVGAVYTNNGQTFTVTAAIVAGTTLMTTGTGLPLASGTLTLSSGTGDATITFSAYTPPTVLMSQAATSSTTTAISFYAPASFVYMESDQQISVIYNNGTEVVMNPFMVNGLTQPAVFFMAGPAYSLTVTNMSTVTANVFFASMG
jgi:hypothetical protein